MKRIKYDISNSARARETIRAIRALEIEENNPLANLDRDDFLEVESQLTPKKWDLHETVFVCYAATQLDMSIEYGRYNENEEDELIRLAIQEQFNSTSFCLYSKSIQQLYNSANLARNESSIITCLIQSHLPYVAIKQIDGFFGPGDLHSEKEKKQWLMGYARDIWKMRLDSDEIEIIFRDSCEACTSSIKIISGEMANHTASKSLSIKIDI